MAIQNTDLLVAYRPGNSTHYKLAISDIPASAGTVPDGVDTDDILIWNGSSWTPGTIDGGEYAT